MGHVPRKDSDTGRFIPTEPAITRVAKRASAAIAAARADVGGGGRDGTAAGITPHGEGAAAGLHAVEGAVASDSAAASRGGSGVPGTVTAPATGPAECVVELESARGRMRVAMKAVALDWASLLHAWREADR